MIWVYPLLSLISLLLLFVVINYGHNFSRWLCLLIFLPMSLLWASSVGFGGDDMPTYLSYFHSYSIQNPFFEGSPFEFSVGVVSSILRLAFQKAESVAVAFRILIFSLIPSLVIITGCSTPKATTARFSCLLFYLFLTPYTFLSASNIVNNGFSMAMLSYALVWSLAVIYSRVLLGGKVSMRLAFVVFALCFFAAFAHPFGLSSVFILALSLACLISLKKLRLLSLIRKTDRMPRYILFVLPVFCSLSFVIVSRLTSTYPDESLLVSAFVLFFVLVCSRIQLHGCIQIFTLQPACLQSLKIFTSSSNLIWMNLASLSAFSIVLGLIGGGDASERYIAFCIQAVLIYSVFLEVYVFPFARAGLQSSHCTLHSSLRTTLSTRSILRFYPLAVALAMNAYFYLSNSFYANIL
jgi:hypothetical protein